MADVSASGATRNPRVVVLGILTIFVVAAGAFAVGVAVGGAGGDEERATEVRGTSVVSTTTSTVPSKAVDPFTAMIPSVRSGVARVEATTCGDGTGTGTGFLVSATEVLTVAHVVDDAARIAVSVGDGQLVRAAQVAGYDAVKGVALLRLDRPVEGHVFELAIEPVEIGALVGVLGFPEGLDMSFVDGRVSGLDRTLAWDDRTLSGLVQTNASVNPGNSGGPMLTEDGRVRGLVEAKYTDAEGLAFAVASDTAIPLLKRWRAAPDLRQPAHCDRPSGPEIDVEVLDDAPEAEGIGQALARYYRAINDGEYEEAWAQYSAAAKQRVPRERFTSRVTTSYDFDVTVHSVIVTADGEATAHVTFTSIQAPGEGPRGTDVDEPCTDWSLDYRMVREGGRWTIDGSTGHAGGEKSAPCADAD